jgi:proton-translocating NADH-quinone oxidoreductase chain N
MIVLIAGAFFVYLIARLITGHNQTLAVLTALLFTGAMITLMILGHQVRTALASGAPLPAWGNFDPGGASLRAEPGGLFITIIATALGLCVAIYSGRYLTLDRRYKTYYPLLLLMVAGLQGLLMATDLFALYIFCELMSVTAYVLVAFRRQTDTAIEAGFKYLIMGSAGTLTLLMGIGLIYRETGSLALDQALTAPGVWARAGLTGVILGLGVKSALVPAHTWLPDAYGRAPSSVVTLSGIIIQGVLYALLKVTLGLGFPAQSLGLGLIVMSLVNMTLGNTLALVQNNTKRMLAYSSIAQMGYAMFSIGVGLRYDHPAALQAGLFLLLAHAAMKGLAFLSKGVCHFYCQTTQVEELHGTFQRLPLVAVTFTLALVGLAGIPPLAGFAGKWFVLAETLKSADGLVYAGLIILLLNTLISLGYYLPLIAALYIPLPPEADRSPIAISRWMMIPLIALSLVVLTIGVLPSTWLQWVPAQVR